MRLDATEFNAALAAYAKETGQSAHEILRDQMRLWVENLIKWTPPTSGGGAGGSAYSVGRKAVEKDLHNIFVPLDNESVIQQWSKDYNGDAKWLYRRNDTGKRFRIDRRLLDYGIGKMADFHRTHRSRRGRTRRMNLADQAWDGRMPVPRDMFKKYVRNIQKRVGRLRAGWLAAANHFHARAPAWVRRHGAQAGGWTDNINNSAMTGEVSASNAVPYARDENGMLARSMRIRMRHLERMLTQNQRKLTSKYSAK